ncbi:PAS domain-containing protein [Tolypothrix sp. PCC 7910]|uniref:helix-turn-helix transcriptional regulator n=1 Tax=Tolypothrix sp. PCC 7910 TaxID=2099387 RepID=UPI0014277E53|nr:helix-turn-helix transcriptional regulator [Tolypothrix sp. PCC 7910]QIR36117.1 PAS domain-containing protein [Tolypothrix sp. PCC 7910]
MITLTQTSATQAIKRQKAEILNYPDLMQVYFFQAVIENLEDGILILNEVGELLHANASAEQICSQLNQENCHKKFVHPIIQQLCQSLIDSRTFTDNQQLILSDEIIFNQTTIFRVRVRWLNLNTVQMPYFLVTIENQYQSLKNIANAEVKKYDLTAREAEIWSLYRGKYSYKDIAAKLYITVNTVKKHMKNIHAKRQAFMEAQQ